MPEFNARTTKNDPSDDITIRVARDLSYLFSLNDPIQTGKIFREKYLIPAIRNHKNGKIIIDLRGIPDYDPDFLEEAFEGLLSHSGFNSLTLLSILQFKCDSEHLTDEIKSYFLDWDIRNSEI